MPNGITKAQAKKILELTDGVVPRLIRSDLAGSPLIRLGDKQWRGADTFGELADKMISELTEERASISVLEEVAESLAAEEAARLEAEEAAMRTPLETASVAWAEAYDTWDNFGYLLDKSVPIVRTLVEDSVGDAELGEALLWIRDAVIETLTSYEDDPTLVQGLMLSAMADMIDTVEDEIYDDGPDPDMVAAQDFLAGVDEEDVYIEDGEPGPYSGYSEARQHFQSV